MKMTANAQKAFDELEKMGCPVRSSEGYQGRGYFWISGEEDNEEWLDYYNNYIGSEKLNDTLDKYNLYFEWYNPGYACVYKGWE